MSDCLKLYLIFNFVCLFFNSTLRMNRMDMDSDPNVKHHHHVGHRTSWKFWAMFKKLLKSINTWKVRSSMTSMRAFNANLPEKSHFKRITSGHKSIETRRSPFNILSLFILWYDRKTTIFFLLIIFAINIYILWIVSSIDIFRYMFEANTQMSKVPNDRTTDFFVCSSISLINSNRW